MWSARSALQLDSSDWRLQLLLTTLNPWQWFFSTRTLSNCLEATLTIIALNYWPWQWLAERDEQADDDSSQDEQRDEDYVHVGKGSPRVSETSTAEQPPKHRIESPTVNDQHTTLQATRHSLRICLLLAALACILRPTNVLIWICLSFFLCLRTRTYGHFMETRWIDSPVWVHITTLEFLPFTKNERIMLLREGMICGYVSLCSPLWQ